jgi:hypothetical protein
VPSDGAQHESFLEHYVRGLGMSARNNSLAYGYSVLITASFGVLESLRGTPSIGDVFVLVGGACVPFAVVNAFVTRGFRRRVEHEPPVVVSLGSSFGVFSVSASVGLAALLAWALRGLAAWAVAAALATLGYLLLSALEIALARRTHIIAGTEDLDPR